MIRVVWFSAARRLRHGRPQRAPDLGLVTNPHHLHAHYTGTATGPAAVDNVRPRRCLFFITCLTPFFSSHPPVPPSSSPSAVSQSGSHSSSILLLSLVRASAT